MDIRIVPRRLQGVVPLPHSTAAGAAKTAAPRSAAAESAAGEGNGLRAAFWYAANFLGGEVEIRGFQADPAEQAVEALYRRLRRGGDTEIDLSAFPALLPPLAVMAAARWGSTRFVRLDAEAGQIAFTARMLRAFGVGVETAPGQLAITGGIRLQGNLLVSHAPSDFADAAASLSDIVIDGCDDERVVMAAAVAASASAFPVAILESDTACASYPDFFVHYQRLGGEVHIL